MNVKKIFLHNIKTIMQADELTPRDIYPLFWLAEKELDDLEKYGTLPSVGSVKNIADYAGVSIYQLFHQELQRKENASK